MEKMVIDKTRCIDEIRRALTIVEKHMIKKAVILYGGQDIDYLLRLKGSQLYEDYAIPDYDFFSEKNVAVAYEIFQDLVESGFDDVGVLSAYHLTTMRVRVFSDNYIVDSSYVGKTEYDLHKKTALKYNGILLRHPYLQYSDQHRTLAYGYEVVGASRAIQFRHAKDFERFNLLYSHYPVTKEGAAVFGVDPFQLEGEYKIVHSDELIAGASAYLLYIHLAYSAIGKKIGNLNAIGCPYPNEVITESRHKLCYQVFKSDGKEYKVVSISWLIYDFYRKMLHDQSYIAGYLHLLYIVGEMYSSEHELASMFLPSTKTMFKEQQSYFDEIRPSVRSDLPPSFYVNGDDEIDELPTDYTYPDVLLHSD